MIPPVFVWMEKGFADFPPFIPGKIRQRKDTAWGAGRGSKNKLKKVLDFVARKRAIFGGEHG
jgi:hypothetical protein